MYQRLLFFLLWNNKSENLAAYIHLVPRLQWAITSQNCYAVVLKHADFSLFIIKLHNSGDPVWVHAIYGCHNFLTRTIHKIKYFCNTFSQQNILPSLSLFHYGLPVHPIIINCSLQEKYFLIICNISLGNSQLFCLLDHGDCWTVCFVLFSSNYVCVLNHLS
jgi:hypothetical protein